MKHVSKPNHHLVALSLLLAALGSSVSSTARADAAPSPFAGKTITVGMADGPPYSYRDKDGKILGYSPDVVRAALEPLGVKLDFVIADFGALIPGLLVGRFDMIAAGVAITPARCQQVSFSEPDLAVGDGLLVPKGNPHNLHGYTDFAKQPDVKLGGGRGTQNSKNALAAGVPPDQLVYFPTNQAMISALLAGRVDAATVSAPVAATVASDENVKGIERALPFEALKLPDGRPAQMYTATVFRKDEGDLRDTLNGGLDKLKRDGALQAILTRYDFTTAEFPPAISAADVCDGKS